MISHNIGGIDVCTLGTVLQHAAEQGYPDVICVQETKDRNPPSLEGTKYKMVHFPRELTMYSREEVQRSLSTKDGGGSTPKSTLRTMRGMCAGCV
jgi:exonuclease III